jgi:hypothetical protein
MVTTTLELEDRLVDTAPVKPDPLTVEEVVKDVRRDSRKDPQAFLDETVVPHGGE